MQINTVYAILFAWNRSSLLSEVHVLEFRVRSEENRG